MAEAVAAYLANAVEIPSPTTDRLCLAARWATIDAVIGLVEPDRQTRGTVYCTLLFISREGHILGRHRKLKPTHTERTVWGEGDALGHTIHDRSLWADQWAELLRAQHSPPWLRPDRTGDADPRRRMAGREPAEVPASPLPMWLRRSLLSRAFASQAAIYVILVGGMRSPADVPEEFRALVSYSHTGDSYIIDPRSEVIAGSAQGQTDSHGTRIAGKRAHRKSGSG